MLAFAVALVEVVIAFASASNEVRQLAVGLDRSEVTHWWHCPVAPSGMTFGSN